MKNILSISRYEFEKALPRITNSTLKQILEGLFEFIKYNSDKYPMDILMDLERKQSIIWKELMARGYLNKSNIVEFQTWLYNKHKKKVW